jgi:uncharacterized protein (DUF1810 family)
VPVESLNRFIDAQDAPRAGIDVALAELRAGRKRTHWIWYVFPQLRGLGSSPMAEHYGIADVAEAEAYLREPRLGRRLVESASVVREQVRRGVPLRTLMGADIDALKLVSSMTLFGAVARRIAAEDASGALATLADVAEAVLDAAREEGYPRCAFTVQRLTTRI